MAMLNVGDFKKGLKVLLDGNPYDILECNFEKPGKGQALYRTKLKNLLSGKILDRTYRSGDGLESADVRRGIGSYSYRDGENYYYLDSDTFEQFALPSEIVGDAMRYLLEGTQVDLLFWNDKLISMNPPQHVILEVTYAEPAARGNTATNVTKGATVETGSEIQVPAFIEQGDKIKIDTASGSYVERVR
jgi:translation elongation factor P